MSSGSDEGPDSAKTGADGQERKGQLEGERAHGLEYWKTRSIEERLSMMNEMRRTYYGEAAVSGRLVRVIEFVRRRNEP
jgi:hypothetical protein